MTVEATKTVATAFISYRSDYCNSLLYGLPDTLLHKSQSVQNATARLITGTWRRHHITQVLRELHWQYPFESVLCSKWHVWLASHCLGRRLSTWLMIAASCQVLFKVRRCSNFRGATHTQQLRRQNFCSSHSWNSFFVQLRDPDITCGLFTRRLKRHTFFSGRMSTVLCNLRYVAP